MRLAALTASELSRVVTFTRILEPQVIVGIDAGTLVVMLAVLGAFPLNFALQALPAV